MKPLRMGPYRLEEPLGTGGMGEVYRAFDERLERSVALKQIRPDVPRDAELCRRLRREAKAVAALNHSSIVQIHDLIESETGDWIVMEYVPGQSLAQLLRHGPLPVDRGIEVARQIALGLSAAHRGGILHRDLKAENILITPHWQAKILDFGLAKSLGQESITDPLTDHGRVLGTYRVMSPEQSRGLPTDARSDLFSFGVLLYEMTTGRSPFLGEDREKTLERLRTHQQQSARELNDAVPTNLSTLIDRLLEKSPGRRPANAQQVVVQLDHLIQPSADNVVAPSAEASSAETTFLSPAQSRVPAAQERVSEASKDDGVAELPHNSSKFSAWRTSERRRLWLGIACTAVLGWGASRLLRAPELPTYVAVAVPRIESSEPMADEEFLLEAVESAIYKGLLSLEGLIPVTVEPSTSDSELVRALAVQEVLHSELRCRPRTCSLTLQRFGGADGGLRDLQNFEVPTDDMYLLTGAINGRLESLYPERSKRPGRDWASGIEAEDYTQFLRLRQASRARTISSVDILQRLESLRRRAPRFAGLDLLEVDILYADYFQTRDGDQLDHIFALLDRALRLAPGDPQTLHRLATIALASGRLELAEETLNQLEALEPNDARLLMRRAHLLERQGQPSLGLDLMRVSVERHPSWQGLLDLASMEYRQGAVDAARSSLERLLASSGENPRAESFLAQLELLGGSLERAVELYQHLIERSPGVAEWSNLGLAQMLLGSWSEATSSFQRAYEKAPDNPVIVLNLADSQTLLGHSAEAQQLYRRVVELTAGAETSESTSTSWQLLTVQAQALAHLDEARAAAAAIQQALQLAPDNPQVAYEAALVYALLGENASALVNVEQGLQGFDTRWFELPWFQDLAREPAFQQLMTASSKGQ